MNEWKILIALFRAIVEQPNFLNDVDKGNARIIFNRWQKEGFKLVKMIEKLSREEDLERITSKIEDAVHELRIKK